ncbi:MAG: phosphoglycerate dehydrogenase [Clostridia bacterium]|nr:phosphoglycerate dehydrogenase [Clostridia bacterium]
MSKIAIIGKQQPLAIRTRIKEYLEAEGHTADLLYMETRNALDWTDELKGYNAIISAGEKFPAEVFEALGGDLKLLSRYGVGTDEIDKAAAAKCGVAVCNAAGTLSTAVAECALTLMLSLKRNILDSDKEVRAGDWSRFMESRVGSQLEGKTVGIIGFGDISKALAKMLSGFDCRVIAYDPFWDEAAAARLNVQYAEVSTIQQEADIISLHLPSTPTTDGMINKEFLSKMKPTAILINTARGRLVVAEDLADALNNGVIAGAGMDVFSPEPPLPDNPLLTAKNTVLMPHMGAGTAESHEKAGMMAAKNVADFFAGKTVKTILNPNYKDYIEG